MMKWKCLICIINPAWFCDKCQRYLCLDHSDDSPDCEHTLRCIDIECCGSIYNQIEKGYFKIEDGKIVVEVKPPD